MMIGFGIGSLSLEQTLTRIEELKDTSAFPVDEEGQLIEDDSGAVEAAREVRLLLQRLLELDARAFLDVMKTLFFHLFAADHDHFRDLMMQASRRDPEATRDLCLEMILSDGVIFLDDQDSLHDLLDVLEVMGPSTLTAEQRRALKDLWARPTFRIPSLHGHLMRFLASDIDGDDLARVRRLFEMDLVANLTWEELLPLLPPSLKATTIAPPSPQPLAHLNTLTARDFEDLRWGVGLEGTHLSIRFRLLGAMLAAGPKTLDHFMNVSEQQPETAFHREHFETPGHRIAFLRSLDRVREIVATEAHHSRDWFFEEPVEREWPWAPKLPPDPWPTAVRFLTYHWGEFANPTDHSEFSQTNTEVIRRMDGRADRLSEMLQKHPLPSLEHLATGEELMGLFLEDWNQLVTSFLPNMEVLPSREF